MLARIGLDALVSCIDACICQYLGKDWVPKKLQETATKRDELQQKIDALSKSPLELTVSDLREAIETKLTELYPEKAIALCEEVIKACIPDPDPAGGNDTIYDCVLKTSEFRSKLEKVVDSGIMVDMYSEKMQTAVCDCFDKDITGDIQLHRFTSMRNSFKESMSWHMEQNREAFINAVTASVEFFFTHCRRFPTQECVTSKSELEHAFRACMIEFLALPVTTPRSSLVSRAMDTITEMPEEKHAADRKLYYDHVRYLDEIDSHYRSIADCS